jgi:hypothetical protein
VLSSTITLEALNLRPLFTTAFRTADELADRNGNVNHIVVAYEKACDLFLKIPDLDNELDKKLIDSYLDCLEELKENYAKQIALQTRLKLNTELDKTIKKKIRCEQDLQSYTNTGFVKMQTMDGSAAKWGFTCEQTPLDGNCLFHAVAQQLALHKLAIVLPARSKPHLVLRALAAEHIRINSEYYQKNLTTMTIQQYVNLVAIPGEWGDHFEIAALVRELNITLVLIQNNGDVHVFKTLNTKPILYLGYEIGHHFQSLRKIDNIPANPALSQIIASASFVEMETIQLHLGSGAVIPQTIKIADEAPASKPVPGKKPSSSSHTLLSLKNFFTFLKGTQNKSMPEMTPTYRK